VERETGSDGPSTNHPVEFIYRVAGLGPIVHSWPHPGLWMGPIVHSWPHHNGRCGRFRIQKVERETGRKLPSTKPSVEFSYRFGWITPGAEPLQPTLGLLRVAPLPERSQDRSVVLRLSHVSG
jgi:hypothetical protein